MVELLNNVAQRKTVTFETDEPVYVGFKVEGRGLLGGSIQLINVWYQYCNMKYQQVLVSVRYHSCWGPVYNILLQVELLRDRIRRALILGFSLLSLIYDICDST